MRTLQLPFPDWKKQLKHSLNRLVEQKWINVGLRAKMAAIVFIGLVGLLTIFALLGISSTRQTTRQALSERLAMAHLTAANFDATFSHIESMLMILADQAALSDPQASRTEKTAALRTGFAQADGDIVLVQDADLEYDPKDYRRLLQPILDGRADVVYGSRFVGGDEHRVLLFWHMVGNRFLTLMSNALTNLNLTDMETCYKVFRREVLQKIRIKSNRFDFEPEITAKVAKGHWRIYEVGISYSGRDYSEGKKIGWKDAVQAIWTIIRYRFFD